MPQFEISTYSSQIFWFGLCFAVLYLTLSNVILPRIRDILKERKATIDGDTLAAEKLENEIDEIHTKTNALRQEATLKYQAKLEEATKAASLKREKLNEELKEKIEAISEKSKEDLKKFIASTKDQSQSAIEGLVKMIKTKLFNIS
jgi:F-type H+-transporting ATPase subunit b